MAPEGGSGGCDGSPARLFMVDAMLGSLARKLRMMGFDAEYAGPGRLGPKTFSSMAANGRILVTRSEEIAARARKAGVACTVVLRQRGRAAGAADAAAAGRYEIVGTDRKFDALLQLVDFYMTNSIHGDSLYRLSSPCPRPSPDGECNRDHDT